MTSPCVLWTIGHSTKSLGEFVEILQAYEIKQLIDIRTIPRSRHNPQFNREALTASVTQAGLRYAHMSSLGGLRKPRKDSVNMGWRNTSFRGYADYMQTEDFQRAVDELTAQGATARTAIMCAEAVPWRCHRSLVADACVVRAWTVRHILSRVKADEHRLTSFARRNGKTLTYPGPVEPVPFLF